MIILPLTRTELFMFGLRERYILKYGVVPNDEITVKFREELIPRAIEICESEGWRYDHALERVLDEMM